MDKQYLFYININASGAVYKFYDENNKLFVPQVGDAIYSYTKTGENFSSLDKYYFVADHPQNEMIYWDRSPIIVNTNATGVGIGDGKKNTNHIFQRYPYYADQNNSVWNICKSLNDKSYLSFNDWYIPSKDEVDILIQNIKNHNLTLENIDFNKYDYWCSSQRPSHIYAWYWDYKTQQWYANYKTEEHSIFVIRSI